MVVPLVDEAERLCWWLQCKATTNFGVKWEGLGCDVRCKWCSKLSPRVIFSGSASIGLAAVLVDQHGCNRSPTSVVVSLPQRQPTGGG
jgi:hypothetical protein